MTLDTYLSRFTERDALVAGCRHHLRMARAARRGTPGLSYRTHRAQAATYRRMLLSGDAR